VATTGQGRDEGEGGGFGTPPTRRGRGKKGGGGGGSSKEIGHDGLHTDGGAASVIPLRVRVMDWSPLGQPRCIGTASFAVDRFRLQAAAAAAAGGGAAAAPGAGSVATPGGGADRCCPPRHRHDFLTLLLYLNGIL
jgi:hypothetical protein